MFIPCVIDVEASGFGSGSYPIEVGFITSRSQTHCTLIKPLDDWQHWDRKAEKLHGISRSVLMDHGKDPFLVCGWLNHHLRGETVYSDAWANDMCWLARLFEACDLPQCFRIESIQTLLAETEKDQWSQTYDSILHSCRSFRHRASIDAKHIQETYIRIKAGREGQQRSTASH